jgi:hypothetical protein
VICSFKLCGTRGIRSGGASAAATAYSGFGKLEGIEKVMLLAVAAGLFDPESPARENAGTC